MKCFFISDNVDTQMGMRLAGVDGIVVHEREDVLEAFDKATKDETIAIVFVTEKLTALCHKEIYDYKLGTPKPLIVEIPDRHGDSHISDTITGYVNEAIGLKI